MKMDYLREFVVLSEELNFSSAAAKLFISQSALSRHISVLEAELGSKLLERDTRNVVLTPFGYKISQKCRGILMQYESLFSDSASYHQNLSGSLSVGLLYYGIAEYYSGFLRQFREKYPQVKLEIRNYSPQYLYHALQKDELDIGDLFWAKNLMDQNLVFHKLYPVYMVAMLPEDHPLAKRDSINLKELTKEPLIDLDGDSVSNISTHEILMKCGVVFQKIHYVNDIEAVPSAVASHEGIHITGERVKRQAYPGISYVKIENREAFTYHCFVHSTENSNPLIPVFINETLSYFRENQGLK